MSQKTELEKLAELNFADAVNLGKNLRYQSRVMFGSDIFPKDPGNSGDVPWRYKSAAGKRGTVLIYLGMIALVLWCALGNH
jgi:hypothetical protein